jgi:hypothetical protein
MLVVVVELIRLKLAVRWLPWLYRSINVVVMDDSVVGMDLMDLGPKSDNLCVVE